MARARPGRTADRWPAGPARPLPEDQPLPMPHVMSNASASSSRTSQIRLHCHDCRTSVVIDGPDPHTVATLATCVREAHEDATRTGEMQS